MMMRMKKKIADDFSLRLYEEMFDGTGVYAVSIEKYNISKNVGARVMIVRLRER